jgi:2-dehydropantoate 2-reductase
MWQNDLDEFRITIGAGPMKIAMMGSGGLGGYLGGCLAQAGQDVTLIARGRQLAAIRHNGLRVRSAQGEFQIKPVQATDQPAEVGPVDLILFCGASVWTRACSIMLRPF